MGFFKRTRIEENIKTVDKKNLRKGDIIYWSNHIDLGSKGEYVVIDENPSPMPDCIVGWNERKGTRLIPEMETKIVTLNKDVKKEVL